MFRARSACTAATHHRRRSACGWQMGSARSSRRAIPRRRGAASSGSWTSRTAITAGSRGSCRHGHRDSSDRSRVSGGTCFFSKTSDRAPCRPGRRRRHGARRGRTRNFTRAPSGEPCRAGCLGRSTVISLASGASSPRRAIWIALRRWPAEGKMRHGNGSMLRCRCYGSWRTASRRQSLRSRCSTSTRVPTTLDCMVSFSGSSTGRSRARVRPNSM